MFSERNLIPSRMKQTMTWVRRMREHVRTERALGSLPEYIQKDIGWPDRYAEQRSRFGL